MNRIDDYGDEVFTKGFADQDVERILKGQPPRDSSLDDLARFVDGLRGGDDASPYPASTSIVEMAAKVARQAHIEAESKSPRASTRPDRRLRLRPALVGLALMTMLTVGLPAFAAVTDASMPGDPLYFLDKGLEAIGIGDGAVDERIAEAEDLMAAGLDEAGLEHLRGAIADARATGNEQAAAKAEHHLDIAMTKDGVAAEAQIRVAEKKLFIEENKGPGSIDRDQFGQGVSDIARGESLNFAPEELASSTHDGDSPVGRPDHVGPKDEPGNSSGNAGPKPGKGPKKDR